MNTLTRQERRKQQREEQILDAAYEMIVAEGYWGLNLDRLAEAVLYSKGTLYQHFRSKEDILVALMARTMQARNEMFQRAVTFPGSSREKLCAISVADELFVKLYPGHFKVEALCKTNSLWEKSSEERRDQLTWREAACLTQVTAIVHQAIAQQDLTLTKMSPEEVVFGLWSMSLGVHTLVNAAAPLQGSGIESPYDTLHKSYNWYLDGLGWRPLSQDHDYAAVRVRIAEEVFADECRRLHGK